MEEIGSRLSLLDLNASEVDQASHSIEHHSAPNSLRRLFAPAQHTNNSPADRYYPINRTNSQTQLASFLLSQHVVEPPNSSSSTPPSPSTDDDDNRMRLMRLMRVDAVGKALHELERKDAIFAYSKQQAPGPLKILDHKNLKYFSTLPWLSSKKRKPTRDVPCALKTVFAAPGYLNDYYSDVLDWGQHNYVGAILAKQVFCMNAANIAIEILHQSSNEDATMTVFKWSGGDARFAAIGDKSGLIAVFNSKTKQRLRYLAFHASKTTCMAWKENTLSVGYASGQVINHDVRVKRSAVGVLAAHSQPVAGLHYSPDYTQLATGGGDNIVNVWDVRMLTEMNEKPLFSLRGHNASVKAVRFCSYRADLLVTGGGAADSTIRFWDTKFGLCNRVIKLQGQVTSVRFNDDFRELIASTGQPHNALFIFNHASNKEVATISGHDNEVLSMTQSPCGRLLMTGSADEKMRIWHIFQTGNNTKKKPYNITDKFSPLRALR